MTVQNSFNAAYDKVTIYTPEGEPHICSRLNARELAATHGFTWHKPPEEAEEAPALTPEPINEPAIEPADPAPVAEPESVGEPASTASIDHDNAPLTEIAMLITGNDDVLKYLEGFTPDALRTMADKRYGEKVSARAAKETVIERIIGFEEAKQNAQNDA